MHFCPLGPLTLPSTLLAGSNLQRMALGLRSSACVDHPNIKIPVAGVLYFRQPWDTLTQCIAINGGR